jgi:hypothetical protein
MGFLKHTREDIELFMLPAGSDESLLLWMMRDARETLNAAAALAMDALMWPDDSLYRAAMFCRYGFPTFLGIEHGFSESLLTLLQSKCICQINVGGWSRCDISVQISVL